MKINFFKKEKKVKQSHGFMYPLREWTLILSITMCLFVGGVSYISYDFYSQFVMPEDVVVSETESIQYRDEDVRNIAEEYTEKENLFNTLRLEKVSAVPTDIIFLPDNTTTAPSELPLAEEREGEYTSPMLAQ